MNKCIYKPGSVSTAIYLGAQSPMRSSHLLGEAGQAYFPSTVLLRIEVTGLSCSQSAGALLPHLSTLTVLKQALIRRYISVALFL